MQINNHQIVDYDAVLDAKFGAEGTPERAEAEEKAYAFYTGQIIEDARKKAKITQAELARRIGSDRSYISRVESGQTEPKVSTFYRIMNALGCRIEYAEEHPDSKVALQEWVTIVKKSEWACFADIKKTFNSADSVGNQHYVFNVKGNNYRLVVVVKFTVKFVYIRFIGTHKEYDKIDCANI